MTKLEEKRKKVLSEYHDAHLDYIYKIIDFRYKRFKDLKNKLECKTNEECIEVIGNELVERGVRVKSDVFNKIPTEEEYERLKQALESAGEE